MYGVVCGAHHRERKGEREAPRGDAILRFFFFFLRVFTVFAGEAGGCSQLLKNATTIGCK